LQELINEWQPKTKEDQEPVTVDFSKMVAYLYGENLGQEDEAWVLTYWQRLTLNKLSNA
ncbi:hypothetical protein IAF33_19035, partial [Acinetobacter baumannii]|nr:hypothetical protein [Acinetobacter baumannii]